MPKRFLTSAPAPKGPRLRLSRGHQQRGQLRRRSALYHQFTSYTVTPIVAISASRPSVSEEKSELPTVTSVWKTSIGTNGNLRHDGNSLPRSSGSAPDFDVGRLSLFSFTQSISARWQIERSCLRCAFTKPAPLEGGPFVTAAGGNDTIAREPRVRVPETDALEFNARLERRRRH